MSNSQEACIVVYGKSVGNGDQMGWPNELSVHLPPFWVNGGISWVHGFEHLLSQSNVLNIDIFRYLATLSALLG